MPLLAIGQFHVKIASALLGLKTAVEKAMAANGGKKPTSEEMAAAMVGIEWDAPPGHIKLALGDGHQAVQSNVAGRSKWDPDAKTAIAGEQRGSRWAK